MIARIQRASGALLIVAGVLFLGGAAVAVIQPGDLGDDKAPSAAATTTTSDAMVTTTTTTEVSTTAPPDTTATTAAAGTTDTTEAGSSGDGSSGLGSQGNGTADDPEIPNTGGPELLPPLGALALALAAVARRLRTTAA